MYENALIAIMCSIQHMVESLVFDVPSFLFNLILSASTRIRLCIKCLVNETGSSWDMLLVSLLLDDPILLYIDLCV